MYREVCCKTLIGKGKLGKRNEVLIEVGENANKTLGCWIINHQYEAYHQKKELFIKGSYDVELWMAVDDDKKSEVYRTTITFDERVNSAYKDLVTLDNDYYLKTLVTNYPTCVGMTLVEPGRVKVEIDSQYVIDVFAEAILVVMCSDKHESDLTLEEEIVMSVNPNYLSNKKSNS